MDFLAIDIETANSDRASICQIGIVSFEGGSVASEWQSLVNPHDHFTKINTRVHGITEDMVKDARAFPDVYPEIARRLQGNVIVSHTSFDRSALAKACERHHLILPTGRWLDSIKVARRAWPEFSDKGYGLKKVTKNLGIELKHHDALQDACAAGHILARAISDTGLDLEHWMTRCAQPLTPYQNRKPTRVGDPAGTLYGQVLVFTGGLSMSRRDAADLAAKAGCEVCRGVTQQTTLLIVGDQNLDQLAGHKKSSKHRKAEKLIQRGQAIRILAESEFLRLINSK